MHQVHPRNAFNGCLCLRPHACMSPLAGSRQAAAFRLPLVELVAAQSHVAAVEAPVALILAPTRELAEHLLVESRRYAFSGFD